MSKKRKYLLAIIIFIILAGLGFFIYLNLSTTPNIFIKNILSISAKDCDDSRQCFLESFSKCEHAKVKTVQNTIEGDRVYVYGEIKGRTEKGCQIYVYNDYSKDPFGGDNTEDYCYALDPGQGFNSILLYASKCEDQSRGDNISI